METLPSSSQPAPPTLPLLQLFSDDQPPTLSLQLSANNTGKRSNTGVTSSPSTPRNQRRRRPAQESETNGPPPFPWATDRPAHIHPMGYLVDNGILSVDGEVRCGGCGREERVVYDLRREFEEVSEFLESNCGVFNDRAPEEWNKPEYKPACSACGKGMRPAVAERYEEINWLFLFLGQTLGDCSLLQLKWFLEQHGIHRTGSKKHALYYSYVSIGSQLHPAAGIFTHLLQTIRSEN